MHRNEVNGWNGKKVVRPLVKMRLETKWLATWFQTIMRLDFETRLETRMETMLENGPSPSNR